MRETLRKNAKPLITFLICLILAELAVVWYMTQRYQELYLSAAEALSVALADAGVPETSVGSSDVDLRHKSGDAWYEVRFEEEGAGVSYTYLIDAETGEIRAAASETG